MLNLMYLSSFSHLTLNAFANAVTDTEVEMAIMVVWLIKAVV